MAINIDNIIIPESGSPCDTWRVYFSKLKKKFGSDNAKTIWLFTWAANGDSTCTTNSEFNKFLSKNDIDVSSAATRAVADITSIGDNILGGFKSMTKLVPIVAGVALVGVLGTVLVILFRTAKNAQPADIAQVVPQGRAAMAASKLLK